MNWRRPILQSLARGIEQHLEKLDDLAIDVMLKEVLLLEGRDTEREARCTDDHNNQKDRGEHGPISCHQDLHEGK